MKRCSKCKIEKDEGEFGKCKDSLDGLYSYCRPCRRVLGRESYLRNRDKIRAKANGNPIILERMRKAGAAYRKTDRYTEKRVAVYGLTLDMYNRKLQDQDNRCAICGFVFTKQEGMHNQGTPHVDHNHITGKVRGLLCIKCNRALGLAGDSETWLDRAKEYLRKYNDRKSEQ